MVQTITHLEGGLAHGVDEIGIPCSDLALQLIESALHAFVRDLLFVQELVDHALDHAGLSDTSTTGDQHLDLAIYHRDNLLS